MRLSAGAPRRRSCVIRVPVQRDTCRFARRNNEKHRGHDIHTPGAPPGHSRGRFRWGSAGGSTGRSPACIGRPGACGGVRERPHDQRGCRGRPLAVCPGAGGGLAGVALGSAGGTEHDPLQFDLPDADPGDVRELPARACKRPLPANGRPGARHRGGPCGAGAGAALDLPRCLRVPGLCPHGRPARTRPLHPCGGRSIQGSLLWVHRLALPALPLRTPLHPPQLCHRAPRPRRGAVGLQGDCSSLEPRRHRPNRQGGWRAGRLSPLGGGIRGPQPGSARACRGRCPQRHLGPAGDGRRPSADSG
jgi:hypothetical protein